MTPRLSPNWHTRILLFHDYIGRSSLHSRQTVITSSALRFCHFSNKMSLPDRSVVVNLLTNGPNRSEVGRKQLTIAFGGRYVASTTATVKPQLVWETESPYPRYYLPVAALYDDIAAHLKKAAPDSSQTAIKSTVEVENIEYITGRENESKAVVERLTVGSKSTTWVRFLDGPLKDFIRFERNDIGMPLIHVWCSALTLNGQTTGLKTVLCSLPSKTHTSASILRQSHHMS